MTSVSCPSPPAPPPARPRRIIRLTPIEPAFHYRPLRKAIHAGCFVVFLVLPFFNLMRLDIPRQRFYFAGQELLINEFGIIFFALMFLMFVIAAASMLYGRIYCGYLCPQMIFSEAAISYERLVERFVTRRLRLVRGRRAAIATMTHAGIAIASVFLAFVFISYFVEPRDLVHRLMRFDVTTAGGVSGAATTVFTFLDFAFVRQRFCTSVCPYGYLQGMLADDRSLLVEYRDPKTLCIECGKCVRVCEMGIDIRRSPHQIECIHCGDCIDACADVMGRVGYGGLIHYTWGTAGELITESKRSWWRRIGFVDAKRVAVVFVLLFYASGLAVALSMRHEVMVRIAPDRSRLYWVEGNEVSNHFRFTLVNRSTHEVTAAISIDGLGPARVVAAENPVRLPGGAAKQGMFEIAAPAGALKPGVNPFAVVVRTQPIDEVERFPMSFVTPAEGTKP